MTTDQKEESDLPKIGAQAMRALASIGVTKLKDLTKFTEEEIMNLRGMGPKVMSLIRPALKANDISFIVE